MVFLSTGETLALKFPKSWFWNDRKLLILTHHMICVMTQAGQIRFWHHLHISVFQWYIVCWTFLGTGFLSMKIKMVFFWGGKRGLLLQLLLGYWQLMLPCKNNSSEVHVTAGFAHLTAFSLVCVASLSLLQVIFSSVLHLLYGCSGSRSLSMHFTLRHLSCVPTCLETNQDVLYTIMFLHKMKLVFVDACMQYMWKLNVIVMKPFVCVCVRDKRTILPIHEGRHILGWMSKLDVIDLDWNGSVL